LFEHAVLDDAHELGDDRRHPPSATAKSTSTSPEPVATDHEFTPNDCEEMGRKYRDLTVSDQEKKLQPGLRPEQIEQGEKAIHAAADELAQRWTDACRESNVGRFAPQESLNCAMHATSVAAFDTCLNAGTPLPARSAKPTAPPKH